MTRGGRYAVVTACLALFWVALPAALWGAARALDARLGWERRPLAVGWLLLAAGLALMGWAMAVLWREGGGLPVSALPPPRLVTHGPFGFSRHPIYLGFNVAVLGAGLLLGSEAMTRIVAPLLLPAWLGYAAYEERGLERRFGDRWRSYRRQVAMLSPRFGLYALGWAVVRSGLLPCRVVGREHLPRRGGAILVHNHACYVDFIYAGAAAAPRIPAFVVTAEAFRVPVERALLGRALTIPTRRYRLDPRACRELIRLLDAGRIVVIAPEGERTPLGRRLPTPDDVASIVARLGYPCVPVGISGAFDVWPRWLGALRRRPVTVRFGPPCDLSGDDPAGAMDRAIAALVEADPQPVHLDADDRRQLRWIAWRCPACLAEEGWRPAELACGACGARWRSTADGRFSGADGGVRTLAELLAPVWDAPEAGPVRARAIAARERSMFGPIAPLEPAGEGVLEVGPSGLRFGTLAIAPATLRSVGVERNDTLQVALRDAMWQFRLLEGSAFRMHRALERARGRGGTPP
jgi:1-acyl-sn-glycerol-3-phosphate acyltransferase